MAKTVLKLLLTIAAFWLAFRNVKWEELATAYNEQAHLYLLLAALLIVGQLLFGALRWFMLQNALNPGKHRFWHSFMIYYASNFFNVCMPSTVGGDVARVLLAKGSGVPVKDVITIVLIDRIMSLVGLAALVAATLGLLFSYLGFSAAWGVALGIAFWVAMMIGFVLLRMLLPFAERLLPFAFLKDMFAGLRQLADKHGQLFVSMLFAMCAHIAYSTAAYALGLSLGADISWLACLALVPLVMFVSTLPISLGGWGIREMGMTTALAYVSVPAAHALLIGLQLGVLTTIVSLFGGLFYLLHKPKASVQESSPTSA